MQIYCLAYVAGILTIINPCILPLVPITIATAFHESKLGPIAVSLGLVVSFTFIGVGITAFGHIVDVDTYNLRRAAMFLLIIFGVVLLTPKLQFFLSHVTSPLSNIANRQINRSKTSGLIGQFVVGTLLGAVWSPCVGPTLGSAIALAATGQKLWSATFTMLLFGFGVSTILLGLAYGSRKVVESRRHRLLRTMRSAKSITGSILMLVGICMLFGYDRKLEAWLLDHMPIWVQDLSISI